MGEANGKSSTFYCKITAATHKDYVGALWSKSFRITLNHLRMT